MTGYNEALDYLYGLEKFGTVLGLENIRWILDSVGNPQDSLKTIHVGGTNGKGSVASMLSQILNEEGYSVGKYTSPHLQSFTERITVNGERVSEMEVAERTARLRETLEGRERGHFFTFFDFTTALALEHFADAAVDVAVIEVGLGGRLDSTNVIHPLASIITNVALDHTDYLGCDLIDIAREKAGIIKTGTPVITGASGVPLTIIEEQSKSLDSPLFRLGREFSYEKEAEGTMSYRGTAEAFSDLEIGLPGDHQLENSAMALCCLETLVPSGISVSETSIRKGLGRTIWEGRLEQVRESPLLLLDGAHNPHAMEALSAFIASHHGERRKILVFGVMRDKAYEEMLRIIRPLMDLIIFTQPAVERALNPAIMARLVPEAVLTGSVREALETAKINAHPGDLILVTGSLYTVGDAKRFVDEVF
jgi:dihydrofolate synthase / folylpolyglutamate synthase